MNGKTCGNCLFSKAEGPQLFCFRYPPKPFPGQKRNTLSPSGFDQIIIALRPPISPEQICGEWEESISSKVKFGNSL